MKNEMDAMKLDERQRLCWLLANRGTLFVLGVAWIALAVIELLGGGVNPLIMIALIPVFALVRVGFFAYYSRQ